MGKNSPSKLRWEARQLEKEKEACFSDYARSILNAARSQQVFQYNPFSSAKAQRMACILKSEGYLKLEQKIKPGWWNLVITEKGVDSLKTTKETTMDIKLLDWLSNKLINADVAVRDAQEALKAEKATAPERVLRAECTLKDAQEEQKTILDILNQADPEWDKKLNKAGDFG